MSRYLLASLIVCFSTACCHAQLPSASPEHAVLKKEAGTWDATVKMWANGPDQEPMTSPASETNKMMGDMWLISEFNGSFGGQSFTGHGMFGFDPEKKKYIGTWVDSMVPSMSMMEGEYDQETHTMTYLADGKGMDGKPQQSKLVTVQKDDNTRVMTMFTKIEDEFVKVLEIGYKRKE